MFGCAFWMPRGITSGLWQRVRFSSQTEKRKLALSRGAQEGPRLQGVAWGERAESRGAEEGLE